MRPFKIIFGSDFAPIRKFAPLMAAMPEAVYGDLLPVLRSADCRIVNLESPLDPGTGFIVKSGAAFSTCRRRCRCASFDFSKFLLCLNSFLL